MAGNAGKSKRSSERAKALRAQCWKNGQQRKEIRVQAQHLREVANRALRKQDFLTPWERACAARDLRRDGMYAVWAKAHPDLAAEQAKQQTR